MIVVDTLLSKTFVEREAVMASLEQMSGGCGRRSADSGGGVSAGPGFQLHRGQRGQRGMSGAPAWLSNDHGTGSRDRRTAAALSATIAPIVQRDGRGPTCVILGRGVEWYEEEPPRAAPDRPLRRPRPSERQSGAALRVVSSPGASQRCPRRAYEAVRTAPRPAACGHWRSSVRSVLCICTRPFGADSASLLPDAGQLTRVRARRGPSHRGCQP